MRSNNQRKWVGAMNQKSVTLRNTASHVTDCYRGQKRQFAVTNVTHSLRSVTVLRFDAATFDTQPMKG